MSIDGLRLTRRTLLAGGAAVLVPSFASAQGSKYKAYKPIPEGIADFPEKKPQLEPKLVKAFVIAGHGNFPAVKEMLEAEPGLLNACWEWGDGDFEHALEGAGHMGNREIATYLIDKGARMTLFCAAMLGELQVVQAMLTANPAMKNSRGPHGLSLMHHAKAGGEKSAAVLEYLKSIGLES